LLASRGELSLYDASPSALDRARERLVAHDLRAHLHVRDAWAAADRAVDGLFVGFWLSHVPRERLDAFLTLARAWLKPGGVFAAIDSLADAASGAADHPEPADDLAVRRLADGREFTIVKVYYTPDELAAALERAGFTEVQVTTTGRFFLLAFARAS
jgi:demethylmenaquinone methyltransferase/2-methoxy-6-polyprenyl-1,4-benzoquinol methylase